MSEALMPKTILHVGCGRAPLPAHFRSPEWREIRYDIDPAVQPDLVGSMTEMAELRDASVDAIWSSHNLEHLLPHEVPTALAEFRRVLRPGGMAYVVVPDVQSLAEKIASGDLEGELYRSPIGSIAVLDVLWGHRASIAAGRHYMGHRTGFSAATLQRRLTEAGFDPVSVERRPQAFELFASAAGPAAIETLFESARQAHTAGRWVDAEVLYGEVVARSPGHWPAWLERGIVCWALKRRDAALAHVRQALAIEPDFARTQATLGAFLGISGQPMAALPHLQRAVELDPKAVEAHYNLGKALQEQGEVAAAEYSYRAVLHLDPDHQLARLNLGNVLLAQWRGPEGLPHYRAATRAIDDPYVQSNWPMLLNFAAEPSDDEVFAAHREFDERMIAPLAGLIVAPLNPPDPGRRLRIGYLSRDFCRHAVRYFLLPIIEHHDHQAFEICCYYFRDRADEVTELFRRHADHWVDCHDLDDDELATRIRRDGIDILVDLAGYTDRNRLLVVGRKPAPVQIAYLGYPASTGIRTLDYRISDSWIDPDPPAPSVASSEMPLRLAHGYYCYAPLPDSPPVGTLPLDRSGKVTFGSLNQAPKLNRPLLEAWAEILRRLPASRLLIQNAAMHAGPASGYAIALFEQLGIDRARLEFRPFGKAPGYLQTYHDVDIALDSFPYNGGTTTCEALWMGVPVVSRCGGRQVARLGLSILNQIGLGDLVADSAEHYVETALALANDADRLRRLRMTMRARLLQSPLMEQAGFTRELEASYREVWRRWCAER